MRKVLLVGNDINNISSNYSWNDLLDGLIEKAALGNSISKEKKPFPLLYEEIYLKSARKHGTGELELKAFIASNTLRLEPNEIHDEIIQLKPEAILTTNYDHTLEKASGANMAKITNQGTIKENRYSLFRKHVMNDQAIWHIHGTEQLPRSIILGYEHYSGYLQQMRSYVATGTKNTYKNKKFKPLLKRLERETLSDDSWVEYFFTSDVFILGLNLDFVEMHLWWLLTYRARAIVTKKAEIRNKIVYFYPSTFQESSQYKLDLLQVNGIETISIPMLENDRLNYYQKVIDYIGSE